MLILLLTIGGLPNVISYNIRNLPHHNNGWDVAHAKRFTARFIHVHANSTFIGDKNSKPYVLCKGYLDQHVIS